MIISDKLKQVFKVQLQISFVESKAEDGTGNIGAVFEVSEEKN